jgi:hypothetical protein
MKKLQLAKRSSKGRSLHRSGAQSHSAEMLVVVDDGSGRTGDLTMAASGHSEAVNFMVADGYCRR